MLPRHDHTIYEKNDDGSYTMYRVVSAGILPAGHPNCPQVGVVPAPAAAPAAFDPMDRGMPPRTPYPVTDRRGGAAPVPAAAHAAPEPLGKSEWTISTDHGNFRIDDPRILFIVISRTNSEGKRVSKEAADAVLKQLKLKSSAKSRGQWVRTAGSGINKQALDAHRYFRFTEIDKHDKDAPKLMFCVQGLDKLDACKVYLIAQDMSIRAARGKYKDVPPLESTGASKATRK